MMVIQKNTIFTYQEKQIGKFNRNQYEHRTTEY
jgi:hypothetical protein